MITLDDSPTKKITTPISFVITALSEPAPTHGKRSMVYHESPMIVGRANTPPTPKVNLEEVPPDAAIVERELDLARVPWPTKAKQQAGILPVRKVIKKIEKGEWADGLTIDSIKKESSVRDGILCMEGFN